MRKMMINHDQISYGVAGTTLGIIGASISVTELQAIISIIVTVAGFIISVLVPLIIKLVKKIRKAKEDGEITKEEIIDIIDTGKEIVEKTESLVKEVSDKKNQKEKK